MLSRTQAPRRYSPSSSFSGSALSSIVRLPRLTVSAAASSSFSAKSWRNSSMVSRLCPPMAVMTSPSLSPQSFAGLSPSEKPTTSTPSEKSLTPTVCPTGISSLTVRSAACADGIAIAAAAKNPSRIAAARFFVRCVPSILSPLQKIRADGAPCARRTLPSAQCRKFFLFHFFFSVRRIYFLRFGQN